MVVLFCKTFRQLLEMFSFRNKRNEPLMVNQAKFFPSNYTNRVVHLFKALLHNLVPRAFTLAWVKALGTRLFTTKYR